MMWREGDSPLCKSNSPLSHPQPQVPNASLAPQQPESPRAMFFIRGRAAGGAAGGRMADSVGFRRRETVRLLPYLTAQPLAAAGTPSLLKCSRSAENTQRKMLSSSLPVSRMDRIRNESITGMLDGLEMQPERPD